MAQIPQEIGLDSLTGGTLPAISVLSGGPGDAVLKSTFAVGGAGWTPSFVAILAVLALNPTAAWALNKWVATWVIWPIYAVEILVVVGLTTFKRRSGPSLQAVTLDLPISKKESSQRRRNRTAATLLIGCSVACLITAGVVAVNFGHSVETLAEVLFGVTVVSCLVALLLVTGTPSIQGELRYDADGKGHVVLKNASPEFVRAIVPTHSSVDRSGPDRTHH